MLKRLHFLRNGPVTTENHDFVMEDDYKSFCARLLLESDILIEEDASFLESVFPSELSSKKNPLTYGIGFHLFRHVKNSSFTLGTVLCYAAAKFAVRISKPVDRVTVALLTADVIATIVVSYKSLRRKFLFDRGVRDVDSFIRRCSHYLNFVNKCLSFVREMEVIGRGFLFTLSGASLTSLDRSHLLPGLSPLSKACNCIRLRHLLFSKIRETIRLFSSKTKELIIKHPLNDDYDHKSHYVAFIDEYEFGRLMTVNLDDDDELRDATDNLSYSALKSLYHLCCIQSSEFVRRLSLCFSNVHRKERKQSLEDLFCITSTLLDELGSKLEDANDELRRTYDFQQLIKHTEDSIESNERRTNKNSKLDFSPEAALTTAVRSLTLHLQVARTKAQDLSSLLESCLNTSQVDSDRFSSLSAELEAISHDLRSCQGCYDESVLRLTKLRNVGTPIEILDPISAPSIESEAKTTLTLPLTGKTDLAPEDQVFVAYVSNDRNDSRSNEDDDEFESKVRSKEQKEVSERMFAELQKVLVSKSEEWQIREAKALARNPNANIHDLETSKTLERSSPSVDLVEKRNESVMIETPLDRSIFDGEFNGTMNFASMAAARSQLWNLNAVSDTFEDEGEEYFESDSD